MEITVGNHHNPAAWPSGVHVGVRAQGTQLHQVHSQDKTSVDNAFHASHLVLKNNINIFQYKVPPLI